MSLLRKICQLFCGCFESEQVVPVPTGFNFSSPRQVDEHVQERFIVPKTDIAVMEVGLPDATLGKGVDLQILKVAFAESPIYDQEIKLPRDARVAQYIVPEGSVYTLTLGYADDNGERGLQVTWAEAVTLTHTDTLMPDAPGPFGEVRMVDEYSEETDGEPPVPGEDPVVEDPVVEDPVVEDPVVEDPVVEDPVVEDPVVEDPVVEDPAPEDPPTV